MLTFIECDSTTLLNQIGLHNFLAISGGRVFRRYTGITLPVGKGYSVSIDLDASDTYCVRRILNKNGKVIIKGQVSNVYCESIGQVAYEAS
jgi:hypothetical protein